MATLNEKAKEYLREQMKEEFFGCGGGLDEIVSAYEDGYMKAVSEIKQWLKDNSDEVIFFDTYNDGSSELSEKFFENFVLKFEKPYC